MLSDNRITISQDVIWMSIQRFLNVKDLRWTSKQRCVLTGILLNSHLTFSQVDQLIKELKSSRGLNEQMKLEMSNSNREKQNFHKQVVLLEDQ